MTYSWPLVRSYSLDPEHFIRSLFGKPESKNSELGIGAIDRFFFFCIGLVERTKSYASGDCRP